MVARRSRRCSGAKHQDCFRKNFAANDKAGAPRWVASSMGWHLERLEEQDTAQLKTVLVFDGWQTHFYRDFLIVAKQANTISRSDFRELVHPLSDWLGFWKWPVGAV